MAGGRSITVAADVSGGPILTGGLTALLLADRAHTKCSHSMYIVKRDITLLSITKHLCAI